jgi:hypothetical protein
MEAAERNGLAPYVRELTELEKEELKRSLRSQNALTQRRARMLRLHRGGATFTLPSAKVRKEKAIRGGNSR